MEASEEEKKSNNKILTHETTMNIAIQRLDDLYDELKVRIQPEERTDFANGIYLKMRNDVVVAITALHEQFLEYVNSIESVDGRDAMNSLVEFKKYACDKNDSGLNQAIVAHLLDEYQELKNFILKSQQQEKELELHRKLFKLLDFKHDYDDYDENDMCKTFEIYNINAEEETWISNPETVKVIKQLKQLVGEDDE